MKITAFITPIYLFSKKYNNEQNIFCKLDIDCILPKTCYKFISDYGVCLENKTLIPIPIPVPID